MPTTDAALGRLLGTTCLGYSASFGGSGDIPERWRSRSCFYFNPTSAPREGGWMQPSRIHHVGLPVTDLDISVAWYREALGLTHTGPPGGASVSTLRLRPWGGDAERYLFEMGVGRVRLSADESR